MEIELFDKERIASKFLKRFGRVKGIFILVMIVWAPLAIMSVIMRKELFTNVSLNIRFLISLPLFLLSHPAVVRKMNWMLEHFQQANIIQVEDREQLGEIIDSTERLSRSHLIRKIIIVIIYSLASYDYFFGNSANAIASKSMGPYAEWWFHFVSQPLYWFVLFNFLVHATLWWRLFLKLSLLKIKVRPTDGDGMGGLGFLSKILNAFFIPAFAFSSAAASGAANLIIANKLDLPGLKVISLGFSIILLILFAGPLLVFCPVLMKTKAEAIHEYGVLSSSQLTDFDAKWVQDKTLDRESLDVGDFSSVADFGSVITRIHEMKIYPVKNFDFICLAFAIGLPFLPVFSLEMPWKDIFNQMFSIVR